MTEEEKKTVEKTGATKKTGTRKKTGTAGTRKKKKPANEVKTEEIVQTAETVQPVIEEIKDDHDITKVAETTYFLVDDDEDSEPQPVSEATIEIAKTPLKEEETLTSKAAARKTVKKKATHARMKRVKKDHLGFNWFFWFSFILIAIPVGYFLWLLYQASLESRTPVLGTRLQTEIETPIMENAPEALKAKIMELEGVESCEVNLLVETLRITINAANDMKAADLKQMNEAVYLIVDELLPIETYFQQHYDYKQYDLEITSYNDLEADDLAIVTLVKNSKMSNYTNTDLTSPKNATLAAELRQELEDKKKAQEEEQQNNNGQSEDETMPLVLDEIMEHIRILTQSND